ncbi:MAG: hypothetical protein R3A13_01940 [Bdellovibrionota bacterium]
MLVVKPSPRTASQPPLAKDLDQRSSNAGPTLTQYLERVIKLTQGVSLSAKEEDFLAAIILKPNSAVAIEAMLAIVNSDLPKTLSFQRKIHRSATLLSKSDSSSAEVKSLANDLLSSSRAAIIKETLKPIRQGRDFILATLRALRRDKAEGSNIPNNGQTSISHHPAYLDFKIEPPRPNQDRQLTPEEITQLAGIGGGLYEDTCEDL